MVGCGFHSVDHEFRADDFDDLKRCPAATGPEIEHVMDEDLAERRGKVRGTMVHHALREGRVVARSDP
jgi:hypothetical protein